jgi:hypothetical protein
MRHSVFVALALVLLCLALAAAVAVQATMITNPVMSWVADPDVS